MAVKEAELQPVPRPGRVVTEEQKGGVHRRDEQVEVAVVVVITDREPAGRDLTLQSRPGTPRDVGELTRVVTQEEGKLAVRLVQFRDLVDLWVYVAIDDDEVVVGIVVHVEEGTAPL